MSPKNPTPRYTVPGLTTREGGQVIDLLSMRLHSLNDLALTLKHIHWNVTGPHFIAVHEMLDPQTLAVRGMADATAERISALGGVPQGTAGVLVAERTWDDYSVGRADAIAHLGALNLVYTGIIEDHRKAAAKAASVDPVTEDLLIEHLRSLEQFQWFVRAHLENSAGCPQHGRLGQRGEGRGGCGAVALHPREADGEQQARRQEAGGPQARGLNRTAGLRAMPGRDGRAAGSPGRRNRDRRPGARARAPSRAAPSTGLIRADRSESARDRVAGRSPPCGG